MDKVFDVAVVGAGPTGLTMANFLGQAGCTCALIEENETTVREPRAVSIDDESLRTMQAIGLADAVVADCATDYGSHYYTKSGACFAKVEPRTREYGFPRRNAFAQPVLEATLRRGLDRFADVACLFSHRCEAIEEQPDRARLVLSRPDGGETTLDARYVVAADGASSSIRKRIGARLVGSSYAQPWLIVDLAATRERLRQTRVVCDPGRPMITLPGPNGIRRYEFMLKPDESEEEATDPAFVRRLLAASGPDADMPVVRRQVYTFHARIADTWRAGRVLLAGDAAHLSPPFAGQGMNSGIRDAHNLSWKLIEVTCGRLAPDLLDTYQRERAPHARALIELAMRMGRIMMPTSPAQAFLVQAAFRGMRLTPRLRSYFAEMKYKPKPLYREGFVAADEAGFAGRMFPQPLVETPARERFMLDDLLGNGFSLVAVGPDAQAGIAASQGRDFGVAIGSGIAVLPSGLNVDPTGPLAEAAVRDVADLLAPLRCEGVTRLFLLRPDRYVCAVGAARDPERFAEAVRRLARCQAEDAKAKIG